MSNAVPKKDFDSTSKRDLADRGVIVTDRSIRSKDPDKVIAEGSQMMRAFLKSALEEQKRINQRKNR